ncbi:MAG: leucine-rich repeat protein [Ruminococcus sp.]|nr:leucine-rich repeat protein [Ruminococcus sp.]
MSFENESRNNSLRMCEDKIKKIKETIESLTAEIADLEAEIGRIKAESDEGESRKADISIGFPDKNAVNGNYEGVSVNTEKRRRRQPRDYVNGNYEGVSVNTSAQKVSSQKISAPPSPLSDFKINKGVLRKYKGSGGDVVIPNSVTRIGDKAFYGCKSLKSVVIPNSVTRIGESAFDSCENLESVDIPNSVTSIEGAAFYNCENLESVDIPNSVTSIGHWAFEGCYSLESVSVPRNCEIYDNSFDEDTEVIRR